MTALHHPTPVGLRRGARPAPWPQVGEGLGHSHRAGIDLLCGVHGQSSAPGGHIGRLLALAALLVAGYAAILVRAAHVQLVQAESLRARHARVSERTETLPALRGAIVDRDGRVLAASRWRPGVVADTHGLDARARDGVARRLAALLDVDAATLRRRLDLQHRYIWVARGLGEAQVDAVVAAALPGVRIERERLRVYPSSELAGRALAAPLIGFSGVEGRGLSGLELALDAHLRGQAEVAQYFRDGSRRKWVERRTAAEERRGESVRLALDATLQHSAETVLAAQMERSRARAGTLLVMDPHTGDVLALAELPAFDPNRFWMEDAERFRARALQESFEPGSTLKPFVVALGLDAGVVAPYEVFDTAGGARRVRGQLVRDMKPHGVLDLAGVLRVSSNIGAAEIGARLGQAGLVDGLRRLGFGTRTGASFPGESAGRVPSLGPREDHELTRLSFGHGMRATAVQLAVAQAAIANGGYRVTPRLVLEVGGEPVAQTPPVRVLSADTTVLVRDMMRGVVESGTGRAAALANHTVAGKTGTAQKFIQGAYSDDRVVASFVGMVPAGAPRLVVVVAIDEPQGQHGGGAVAAPVFREFAEVAVRALGVPGDLAPHAALVPKLPGADR
jgi:cell division protein FtsI (penicillin-binding protein 3)